MLVTNNCLEMIMDFEGFEENAYWDVDGYSIGYGHHGKDVNKDDYITHDHAYKLLIEDVLVCEKAVNEYTETYNWTQNEFDALVCFAYNLGVGSIKSVTQNGTRNKVTIAEYMLKYVFADGKKCDALVKRRQAEHDLFVTPSNAVIQISGNTTVTSEYTENTRICDIVDAILEGKFGNGDERKENIYNLIQFYVNKRYE